MDGYPRHVRRHRLDSLGGASVTSYAAQKGRSVQTAPPQKTSEPAALSRADEDRVAANKLFVQEHMADMIHFFKELHANGMIDGWRAVVRCRTLDENCNE